MHVKRIAVLAAPLLAIPAAVMLNPMNAKAGPDPAGCNHVFQAVTCEYTGNAAFDVPNLSNVMSINVRVQGASGVASGGNAGGLGAVVTGTLAVTDTTTFTIQIPDRPGAAGDAPGGAGGNSAALVRDTPGAFIVAGGGGGGGVTGRGGNAGTNTPGENGQGAGGGAGGSGATPIVPLAAAGGSDAGGGGAGSVGNGANGSGVSGTAPGGGGGGGSSFATGFSNVQFSSGVPGQIAKVVITYTDTTYPAAPNGGGSSNGTCNGLTVTVPGGSGNDTLNGTAGPDVIDGGSGNDIINALGGNDVICGGSGNDTINGGGGTGTVFGNSGNDTLNRNGGSYTFDGGSGNDVDNL